MPESTSSIPRSVQRRQVGGDPRRADPRPARRPGDRHQVLQPYRQRCQCARREPRHVRRALEASLKRLGTDRVDILFPAPLRRAHAARRSTCARSRTSVRSGKALYAAVSNYSAWQTQAGARLPGAKLAGAPAGHPADVQPGESARPRSSCCRWRRRTGWRGRLQPGRRRAALRAATCRPAPPAAIPPTRCTRCATATNGCTRPRRSSSASARSAAGIRSARPWPGSAPIRRSPRRSSAPAASISCAPRSTR
jgi:hypothetical protein